MRGWRVQLVVGHSRHVTLDPTVDGVDAGGGGEGSQSGNVAAGKIVARTDLP